MIPTKPVRAILCILTLVALTGCALRQTPPADPPAPEELTERYVSAITAAAGTMVEENPLVTRLTEETAPMLEYLNLSDKHMLAFAASTTMMNVKAYGIAAVMPAPGSEAEVTAALQSFIDHQIMAFQFYLPDQREIAKSARLETLPDGTVLMVMTEDADTVFHSISSRLAR